MRLEDLLIFTDVIRYHSMNIASEIHEVSPQNLSKIIRDMEREIGVVLFRRSRKGSELTQAGEKFYLHIIKVLRDYEKAVEAAKRTDDQEAFLESASIRVLSSQGAMNYAVLNAYNMLLKEGSYDIAMDLETINIFNLDELMTYIEGECYDVLAFSIYESNLEQFTKHCKNYIPFYVFQDETVLVASKTNPLAKRSLINASELENFNLILSSEMPFNEQFFDMGITPRTVLNSLNMIIEQVEHSNEYCTLVGKSLVGLNKKMKRWNALAQIPLDKKVYGLHIIMLHEKSSDKKWVRSFGEKIVQNINDAGNF